MKKIFFPLGLLMFMIQACNWFESPQKCVKEYAFEIPFSLAPSKDTFLLGDTIWIESSINQDIIDENSGSSVFIDTFDFKVYGKLSRIIDTIGFLDGENSFSYINEEGGFVVLNYSRSKIRVKYKVVNKTQVLKVGLIPEEVGAYKISFYNKTADLWDVDFPEDCMVDIVDLSKKMNEGVDNNFDLVKDYYKIYYADYDYDENGFNHSGSYAFVVIE